MAATGCASAARAASGAPTDDHPLLVIDGITVSSESLGNTLSGLAPGDIAVRRYSL